jgi:hypothetical protein
MMPITPLKVFLIRVFKGVRGPREQILVLDID